MIAPIYPGLLRKNRHSTPYPLTRNVGQDWIFEKPEFNIEGFGASDVIQGRLSNCWWLASVAALCNVWVNSKPRESARV